MTCPEFQKALPYIIESGGSTDEETHLKTCPVCSDLVKDLQYIAEAAKLLVPMEEPHPRVWHNIQEALQREGGMARRGRFPPRPWQRTRLGVGGLGWLAAVAAVLVVAVASLNLAERTGSRPAAEPAAAEVASGGPAATIEPSDRDLLLELAPAVRSSYEQSLRSVNAYIQEAQMELEQYPESEAARTHLRRAYTQKNMLYEMALARGSR